LAEIGATWVIERQAANNDGHLGGYRHKREPNVLTTGTKASGRRYVAGCGSDGSARCHGGTKIFRLRN